MKRSGSVTVFLALVITCCSALICALTESARTAGARFYVRTMADAAVDSMFSQYHCQLWECYRLLGYSYESDEKSAQELQNFMRPYVENCGWYAVSAPSASLAEKTFLHSIIICNIFQNYLPFIIAIICRKSVFIGS